MQIKVFKPEEYRNCKIYYRNFKDHFEYLTIVRKELYTAHITIRPSLITKIFYWLGAEKYPYSEQQLKAIIKSLRRMAETTIDFVFDKKE